LKVPVSHALLNSAQTESSGHHPSVYSNSKLVRSQEHLDKAPLSTQLVGRSLFLCLCFVVMVSGLCYF